MIKIIDYKAGNAPSVMCAVRHLGYDAEFARNPADLENASFIILPGVGSARATMDSLREMDLLNVLEDRALNKKTPFLGICVGMQILFEHSEEENADCLGWLGGSVVKRMRKITDIFPNLIYCKYASVFFLYTNP